MGGGAGNINVNEHDPLASCTTPRSSSCSSCRSITMRTYSEEKRSGTIELLLTSPITDLEIILGKFLGAMGLYAAMLLVTLLDIAHALLVRQPRMAADRRRLPRAAAARRLLHVGRPASSRA